MGAEPWFNIVPYEEDIATALQKARAEVFRTGNYILTGRRKPRSIEEAVERGGEEGTSSILDVNHVAKRRTSGAVAPLTRRTLLKLFGTERPQRETFLTNPYVVWDWMDRGQAVYIILYQNDKPHEILFTGSSWD
jgi:hypothetical protein